ncbi:MAG: tetratricopeptide repeat protein [Candidatus Melainabacteria bacterium]|nr:MAG: tetratricopeptide repeat protein [Candidatus Melainabacteria bacterium]
MIIFMSWQKLSFSGDYEKAIATYDKAFELDNSNVDVLFNKAGALCAFKKYDDAISLFEKLLKKGGKNSVEIKNGIVSAYLNKANEAEKTDNFKEAIELCEKALNYDNKNIQIYVNLSKLYEKSRQ